MKSSFLEIKKAKTQIIVTQEILYRCYFINKLEKLYKITFALAGQTH